MLISEFFYLFRIKFVFIAFKQGRRTHAMYLLIGVRGSGTGYDMGRGIAPSPPPQKKIIKPLKLGQMLGKMEKRQENVPQNMLNLDHFITIFHKNSGKPYTSEFTHAHNAYIMLG
jgi:hypothetical protein